LPGLIFYENLIEINLNNNGFSEIGLNAFVDVLEIFKSLKTIGLTKTNLNDGTFIKLCYRLPELK